MVLADRYVVNTDIYEFLLNFTQAAQRVTTGLACNTEDVKNAMKVGAVYEHIYSDGHSKTLRGFVVTSAGL